MSERTDGNVGDNDVWGLCQNPMHDDPPEGGWTCPDCRGYYWNTSTRVPLHMRNDDEHDEEREESEVEQPEQHDVDVTEIMLQRMKLGALQVLDIGLVHDLAIEASTQLFFEHMGQRMAVRMMSSVLGVEGNGVYLAEHVQVPKFPRWLPKWLRRRWTTMKDVEIEATPWVVFPEMTWVPPEFGEPKNVVVWNER